AMTQDADDVSREPPSASPFSTTPTSLAAAPTRATTPEAFRHLEHLAPRIATLPGRWAYLADLHAVFAATALPTLPASLRPVLDPLGFALYEIDETQRVATQQTVTGLRVVARHEDFYVVAAAATYAGFFTTSYETIFQLHPRAIVFALERGHRIRVVAREQATGDRRLRQRVLRGGGRR